MRRNGYIDVIKFVFAILIAEFHLNSGLFLGGRLAVEGFFIITGYLMVRSIERDKHAGDKTGVSTVRFIFHKYAALFPYLLPSTLLASIVYCLIKKQTFVQWLTRLPLLLFDIFPLHNAGFKGEYVVGISWYLSSMFIALAILYPLCRRFRDTFILVACPLIVFINYGVLSHYYGNIAVGSDFFKDTVLNTGIMRALAGCSLGCIACKVSNVLATKKITNTGRTIFTIAEFLGFFYFFYAMNAHVRSAYDYILVFLLFGLLIIGINGLSFTTYLWNTKWTRPLGTASTLIVLNHYCYGAYLRHLYGSNFAKTEKAWLYIPAVIGACLISYLFCLFIKYCMKMMSKIKLFEPNG